MNVKNLFFSLLVPIFLAACGSDESSHAHPELKTGKQLFNFHCAACHGEDGMGKFLSGIPANKNTQLTINQIIERIRKKEPGDSKRKMPVFSKMSEKEADKIANYLLELREKKPLK